MKKINHRKTDRNKLTDSDSKLDNFAGEKNLRLRQILGVISILAIVVNLYMRFSGKYGDLIFWVVLIIVAIIAWPVMNWLKK